MPSFWFVLVLQYEPAVNPAEAREVSTVPDTDPDMGPGTAGAVGMTEPATIGFPVTPAATSEAAGGLGGGPGLGGRLRPGRPLCWIVQHEKKSKILSVFFIIRKKLTSLITLVFHVIFFKLLCK